MVKRSTWVFTDKEVAEFREGILTLGKLNKSQIREERGRTQVSSCQGSVIRGKCGKGILRDDPVVYKAVISFLRFELTVELTARAG